MNNYESKQSSEPKIGRVLRNDFKQINFLDELKREYSELKKFYIDDNKKARLERMSRLGKWGHEILWIFKSMFLRLTPLRRLLVLFGIILIISSHIVYTNENHSVSDDKGLFGGILILFVLVLELKDKLLAKDELEAGRKLQQALMPESSPNVPGWSLWLFTRSANEVGGDLVDYLKIKNEKTAIVLADVAGKGLKADLLMAKLQASIRALAPDYDSLSKLGSKLHEIFHRDSLPGLFASMVYVELVPDSGELKSINAGHLPPILLDGGGIHELPKGEPALGLMEKFDYSERTINLNTGDIFLAYSDGVTEAQNENGEFFGTARLHKIITQVKNLNAEGVGQSIVNYVDNFVGNASTFDDLSIIILKKL